MSDPSSYARESAIALRAVHRASVLTKSVLRSLNNNVEAETKADDSPVTVADFAAQALIISSLHDVFPGDTFIGEESANALRENETLRSRVWDLVSSAASAPTVELHGERGSRATETLQPHEQLGRPETVDSMLEAIDLGTSDRTSTGRVWVLDPVDGTATFMKGQQYAVCLCLLVDGVQQVAVIGCPNLKLEAKGQRESIHEDQVDEGGYGVVLSAVKGEGAFVRKMHEGGLGSPRRIQPGQSKRIEELDFVEVAWGKTSLSQSEHRAVAENLGAQWPGTLLWSQQMKYIALTLGATDVMVRIPKGRDRYSYIWDHAGGQLLFEETGGVVKDLEGKDIEFSHGRKIVGDRNFGMVAARPWAFDRVMEAVQEVLKRRTS
ncbi:carbohydrate phosphatase [Delitschia confertaspora ATCC 74209]|uniref:Carbohydrate phosphatase n=1 Tax=Delitschia confertaspora ATCC 74209 TaxID=1513339 RepID=A0A9P4MY13_9PLEO|nr:carbohydrate phosphatase [Delitschia confertaspora ATCC 74209]